MSCRIVATRAVVSLLLWVRPTLRWSERRRKPQKERDAARRGTREHMKRTLRWSNQIGCRDASRHHYSASHHIFWLYVMITSQKLHRFTKTLFFVGRRLSKGGMAKPGPCLLLLLPSNIVLLGPNAAFFDVFTSKKTRTHMLLVIYWYFVWLFFASIAKKKKKLFCFVKLINSFFFFN